MKKIYNIIAGFLSIIACSSHAQDLQLSQFYAASTLINPAFAGSAHYMRLGVHERIQWPKLSSKYVTHLISLDQFVEQYNSGFGGYLLHDRQGHNTLSSSELALQYAYEVPINDHFALRLGLQGSAVYRYINYSDLRFSYQYSDEQGYDGSSNGLEERMKWHADFSTGVMLYSDHFWAGISVHHLNRPNLSILNDKAPLPMRYGLMLGYKIPLKQSSYSNFAGHEKDVSISPTLHYKRQGVSSQLDVGLYGVYDHLLFGSWYRGIPTQKYSNSLPNNESVVMMIGWKKYLNFEVRYSYDLTISKLAQEGSGGSHELSASFLIKSEPFKKHRKRLPCPSHHVIKSYDFL